LSSPNGGDPLPSSIYNVQTLKNLVFAGENSINILKNNSTNFNDAISENLNLW
jgi:hypothetical protein